MLSIRRLRRFGRRVRNAATWIAWGIVAPIADGFDRMEGLLCLAGVDIDVAARITQGAAALAAACLSLAAAWELWFCSDVTPQWLLEPVVFQVSVAPRIGALAYAFAAVIGICVLSSALCLHLCLSWLLRWALHWPRRLLACAAYVVLWHTFVSEPRNADHDD